MAAVNDKTSELPRKRGIFTILRRFSAPRAGALCTRLPGLQDSQVLHVHRNHTAGVEVIEGLGAVEAQGDRRLASVDVDAAGGNSAGKAA